MNERQFFKNFKLFSNRGENSQKSKSVAASRKEIRNLTQDQLQLTHKQATKLSQKPDSRNFSSKPFFYGQHLDKKIKVYFFFKIHKSFITQYS